MEPSGRNPWQPVAIAKARNGGSKPKTVAVGCDRLREKAHGKGALPLRKGGVASPQEVPSLANPKA